MAFIPTRSDHEALDDFFHVILQAYAEGKVTLPRAREALCHAVVAAVEDETELRLFIRLPRDRIFAD